jgi:excisionase family DNA binding protein
MAQLVRTLHQQFFVCCADFPLDVCLYVRMTSADVPRDSGSVEPATALGPYLKAYEAAEILGCSPQAVTQLCREGELPASRPMKAWLIDPADLRAYITAHRNDQVPA